MKNKKNILFMSSALIFIGAYFIYKHYKGQASPIEDNIKSDNTISTKTDWDKVLKLGSKGREVEILQKALKQLTIDGDFGPNTEKRLKNVMKVTETTLNQYNEFFKNKK